METRANFFLIGATAVIGAALILFFSAWMIGGEWRVGAQVYDVVFDGPVRGLVEGGEVRYNGIKVGEVRSLRIDEEDPSRIVARVRVSSAAPLREDSHAELEAIGITGVTLVQLFPGSKESALLKPSMGRPARIRSTTNMIDTLLTHENAQRLSDILIDLKAISGQLAAEDSVLAESARAARSLSEASRSITDLSRSTEEGMSRITMSGDRALLSLDSAGARAASAFERLEGAAWVAEERSLPEMSKAAGSLQRASDAFETAVDKLNLSGETKPKIKLPR